MAHSIEMQRGDNTAAPVNNCQIATPCTQQHLQHKQTVNSKQHDHSQPMDAALSKSSKDTA